MLEDDEILARYLNRYIDLSALRAGTVLLHVKRRKVHHASVDRCPAVTTAQGSCRGEMTPHSSIFEVRYCDAGWTGWAKGTVGQRCLL
jgi:hypothetical protein